MGIATQNVTNSAGIANSTIQAFTTDAVAAADTIFSFGFKPRSVKLINLADRTTFEYYEGMAATQTFASAAAGTQTLDVSSAIVVNADGTVTVKAAQMVASKSFVIIANG